MQTYWMKFTDGTTGYCEGQCAYDAVRIAEHITKKTVAVEAQHKYSPEKGEAVKINPYPTRNMIWQHDHPIFGKTPGFCLGDQKCVGRGACPRSYSCCE